jgi:hypothetical protein
MGSFPKTLKDLCTPAAIYFIISIIALLIVILQNLGNSNRYCIGNFSCRVPSTILIFIIKFIYIVFWTYILNLICKDGHVGISWLLVLLPWILLFVIIGLLMLNI